MRVCRGRRRLGHARSVNPGIGAAVVRRFVAAAVRVAVMKGAFSEAIHRLVIVLLVNPAIRRCV